MGRLIDEWMGGWVDGHRILVFLTVEWKVEREWNWVSRDMSKIPGSATKLSR